MSNLPRYSQYHIQMNLFLRMRKLWFNIKVDLLLVEAPFRLVNRSLRSNTALSIVQTCSTEVSLNREIGLSFKMLMRVLSILMYTTIVHHSTLADKYSKDEAPKTTKHFQKFQKTDDNFKIQTFKITENFSIVFFFFDNSKHPF